MSYDHTLGERVHNHLVKMGCETPMTPSASVCIQNNKNTIQKHHLGIMDALGLSMTDDSLAETPHRVAKMYCQEVFTGLDYGNFPKCTTVENKMRHSELVIVKNADVLSLCEHHFVPFIGKCCIGYIPSTHVMGLSKFNRVVDFFSRRPQIQERLVLQIYHALSYVLQTEDIAVTIEAEHMCVRLRGVKQQGSTVTSHVGGRFMTTPALREEFLTLSRR